MATDFFERQETARRNTSRLVLLFALAVMAIIISVDLLGALLLAYVTLDTETGLIAAALPFVIDPRILAVAVGGTIIVVVLGSLYKVLSLWGGGHVVAEHLGGRRLNPDTADPAERQLLNVVEEMAIASGTPTPPVFLLDNEGGINAFAAGYALDDAVIGVTRGTAERLSRDELQGVIAHEFSHVLNGDMGLNLRLISLLHGILIIGLLGQFIFRIFAYSGITRRGGRGSDSPVPVVALGALVFGLGLMVIGFAGTFFGSMIKAAVSRQREFLADASAVQFTRNPLGIADALKKIGGFVHGASVESPNALEVSHLFFGQAVSGLRSVFSTHPPLSERIERLDPSWDGQFIKSDEPLRTVASGLPAEVAGVAAAAPFAAGDAAPPLTAAIRDVGQPGDVHLAIAGELLARIPSPLVEAAHDTYSARALIYALLLDREPACRERQLDHLSREADRGVLEETKRLIMPVARLEAEVRLPLVDIAMPALDALTEPQYQLFKRNVGVLIAADDRLALFEWALQRILLRQLDRQHGHGVTGRARQRTLRSMTSQCSMMLSMLAWIGHPTETVAAHAFTLGWAALGLPAGRLLPMEQCDFGKLDQALTDLDGAGPAAKRKLLHAAAACIESDATVTVNEFELLRAIAASLSCPMPPLAGGGSSR